MKLILLLTLLQRIISLSPSATEILHGIGAFDRVIAVSNYCEYPPEVEYLPRVGGWTNTNLELVVALKPDLVVLTGVDAQAPLIESKLAALGIQTLSVSSQSLSDIFLAIESIGKAVGNQLQANELITSMRKEIVSIEGLTHDRPKHSVLVVVDRLPGTLRDIYVATGGSYLTELVEIAGGIPITPPSAQNYTRISAESLVAFNPEVIFDMVQALNKTSVVGGGSFTEDVISAWEVLQVKAVESGRIYQMENKRFVHPSQFAIETLREFVRILHPGIIE